MKNHIRGYALRDTDFFKIVYFNTNDEICKETGKYDLYTEQKKIQAKMLPLRGLSDQTLQTKLQRPIIKYSKN